MNCIVWILCIIVFLILLGISILVYQIVSRKSASRHKDNQGEGYTLLSSPQTNLPHSPLVTLITLTSPSRFDPSIDHIKGSLSSLRKWKGLENARSIIVADGRPPKTKYSQQNYELYLKKLKEMVQAGSPPFHSTSLLIAKHWKGPNKNIAKAVSLVHTPYLYSNQHDLVFDGEKMSKLISFPALTDFMNRHDFIDYLVFQRKNTASWFFRKWFEPSPPPRTVELPIQRAYGWSDADHVAKTSYWKTKMIPWLSTNPKRFPEDFLHPTIKSCKKDEKCLASKLHGAGQNLWIWNEPMVFHLDGQSKL